MTSSDVKELYQILRDTLQEKSYEILFLPYNLEKAEKDFKSFFDHAMVDDVLIILVRAIEDERKSRLSHAG